MKVQATAKQSLDSKEIKKKAFFSKKKKYFLSVLIITAISCIMYLYLKNKVKNDIEHFLKTNNINYSSIQSSPKEPNAYIINNLETNYGIINDIVSKNFDKKNTQVQQNLYEPQNLTIKLSLKLKINKFNKKQKTFSISMETDQIETKYKRDRNIKNIEHLTGIIKFPKKILTTIAKNIENEVVIHISSPESLLYDNTGKLKYYSKNFKFNMSKDLIKNKVKLDIESKNVDAVNTDINNNISVNKINDNEYTDFKVSLIKEYSNKRIFLKVNQLLIKSPIYNFLMQNFIMDVSSDKTYLFFDIKANNYKYFIDNVFNKYKIRSGYQEDALSKVYKKIYNTYIPKIKLTINDSSVNKENDLIFNFKYDANTSKDYIYINQKPVFKVTPNE